MVVYGTEEESCLKKKMQMGSFKFLDLGRKREARYQRQA